jgi:hypothetical protein
MNPYLTIDQIIDRAITLIATHPLFTDPIVLNDANLPLRINRIRDFDGLEINPQGITLSIFPYSYQGSSNETVTSNNAAVVFTPYNVGSASEGFDMGQLSLVVKLQAQGIDRTRQAFQAGTPAQLQIERSTHERTLYRWMTIMRALLLTNPVDNLAGLVRNSTVNWISYRTTKWDGSPGRNTGGENFVFHTASILWQLYFNAPRNYRLYPAYGNTAPNLTPVSSWIYVGVRTKDCTPVYWDSKVGVLVTDKGFPIRTTPKGTEVVWSVTNQRFETRTSPAAALTDLELVDTSVTPNVNWVDRTRKLVGVLMPSRENLFWKTDSEVFVTCSGQTITQLEDCDNIQLGFNDTTQTVVDALTGQPIPRNACFIPLKPGMINIYDANSLELREDFTLGG